MFRLERIDHVALTVRDVERSVSWYQDVLGLARQFEDVWGNVPAVVGTAQGALALFPGPDTLCFRHVAFGVDRTSFDEARVGTIVQIPDAPAHTLRSWLWFILEHELHHRGQVWAYLRMMKLTPPFYAMPLPLGERPDVRAREELGGF